MAVAELNSPEEMVPLVHAALRAWYSTADRNADLLDGLILVQEARRSLDGNASPTALRLATNQVLLDGIEELELADQQGAEVLKLRFADDNTLMMVANKINVSEHTVSRIQRAAIVRLAAIIYERELEARGAQAQFLVAQLPPRSYSQLFGVEEGENRLLKHLLRSDGPGVVAIVGIGGIGKTALADAVTRRLAHGLLFEGVAWLRSEPQTMSGRSPSPQFTFENMIAELASSLGLGDAAGTPEQRLARVRQVLKSQPHLVVIDNLESDAETAYLLDHLNDLASPSKFLLTTRARHASQTAVFYVELGELPLRDAKSLVTRHARDIGLPDLFQTDAESIQAIYDVTGGNPLALKLVVSLLDLLPLQRILTDLKNSRPGPIEDLYKHIYWQAWRILSQDARSLLQAMPLVGETGGLPEYLQIISKLPDSNFWPALQELRSRSLVEIRGTIQEKRYGVHRLTESFLRTEIINWPDE